MIWIRWMSLKDNDGRRSSGVRYNTSAIHLAENADAARSACGREVVIPWRGRLLREDGKNRICGRCRKQAEQLGIKLPEAIS